jgi:hypothetical protein
MYVIVHSVRCIPVRRCWIDVNVHTLQALVRNFLPMDMSEVILNSVTKERSGVRMSAVQEIKLQNYKERSKNVCSTRDQVAKLFIAILIVK